ncbi:hypothetical protein PLESTB_001072600 [Pleodorina starrii]|uniref:Uncharacterized protein n=1 Tax=Pleodorina starrii TaxID=330485 RepID=A0A9W6BRD4_9CHLO|nr:hypothetical protein PLESTM_001186700 [Pleodorina starrii]GLC56136.1 hypothetical protein PLESTB_001072600 [Pleodorina starrii]GLC74981.1 hypothetical protein PLESTF_001579400 [Pleodorina starrii]
MHSGMFLKHQAAKLSRSAGVRQGPSITRRSLGVFAQKDDKSGDSPVDWDGAWSSFQRQLRSQVEVKSTTSGRRTTGGRAEPRKPPPRRVLGGSSSSGGANSWGGQEGERIRRAERVLVDLWSNADFLKAGTAASIILLVVFVLIVGPPPPDGRCSLYWC